MSSFAVAMSFTSLPAQKATQTSYEIPEIAATFRTLAGWPAKSKATDLAEYRKVGLVHTCQADGELLYDDTSSPAPFVVIANHS